MPHPTPFPITEGQESVWDYPRPPALEPVTGELKILHAGLLIARTTRAYRVLETSHPPVYYFPPGDCHAAHVITSRTGSSFCEWKGDATYVDVHAGGDTFEHVGWRYDSPTPRFEAIRGYIAFYAAPFDECTVRGEQVTPQPGGFYGGWITPEIIGPFKGIQGSWSW